MAINTSSSAMMDGSTLQNLSSILRDFSDLSEENKKYLCQHPQSLGFIVNLFLQENATIVENVSAILRNISNHLAVDESLRLILRQNRCYEKLLQLLQSQNVNLVSNACIILSALSAGCASDQKTLVDLGAISLLSHFVTSKHEAISMASSVALHNLLTFRNTSTYNNFNSELNSEQIHFADPVNHTQVSNYEGSSDELIDFSNRFKEFQDFMSMSSHELPKHYCTEGTPDGRSSRHGPVSNFNLQQIVHLPNTDADRKLHTETVASTFDPEEVPVDYSTKYSAEYFSGGSSVSSLSKLSLRSLENPGLIAQLSMLKEGLGSNFDFAQLLCTQQSPSSSLPNLSTPITSTPSKPPTHLVNDLSLISIAEAEDKAMFNDSLKDTSTSSSSFSCSSEESGVGESSVDHCLELAMPKSKDNRVFVCPVRKSCEGSSLDQTKDVHQDKNTPSVMEKSCFSEDGEGNVTVIYKETTNNEQHDIQDDIADAFDNFYNKTTFEEVERSRFLVSDAQLLEGPPRAISNAFDNSYNKTNLKEMEKSRFLVSDAQLLEGPPTSLDKKSSKTKFSKPFGLSLRKKKNHQKSNQMRDDGTKTKKMTFIEDE